LLLRRQRSGGSLFKAIPDKLFVRPYLEKPYHKNLGWWTGGFKVKALSSSPTTAKKKKKKINA
jgi:hypothetical protein